MARPDPYADIDFEEINEQTGLALDEIKCLKVELDIFLLGFSFSLYILMSYLVSYFIFYVLLLIYCVKVCFNLFDVKKQDFLSGEDLGDIMRSLFVLIISFKMS